MSRLTVTAWTIALALALLVSPLAAEDKQEAVKKELATLQGEWVGTSFVNDGKEQDNFKDQKPRLTIKGSGYKLGDNDQLKGTFEVDPARSPKAIDVTVEGYTKEGKFLPGVYEVKGDELKVCLSDVAQDRPTEVTAKEGSKRILFTFKRVTK